MDPCVRLYLQSQKKRLERKQLAQTIKNYRDLVGEVGPVISEHLKRDKARRSKGDSFIILDRE